MAKIFISYRREDSQYAVDRIYEALRKRLKKRDIFMDVDDIPKGVDFVDYLSAKVAQCETLVAVIGPQWLSVTNKAGERRLDDPEDFVRIEIAAALKRGIPVVPVLLDGTPMPTAAQLPEDLRGFERRNGADVHRRSLKADIDTLVRDLGYAGGGAPWGKLAAGVALAAGVLGVFALVAPLDLIPGREVFEPDTAIVAPEDVPSTPVEETTDQLELEAQESPWPYGTAAERLDATIDLQTALKKLGYYSGGIDGMVGAGTIRAVTEFAEAANTTSVDFSRASLADLVAFTHMVEQAADDWVRRESAAWRVAEETDTVFAFRTYLREFPSGANAYIARSRIEVLTLPQEPAWRPGQTFRDTLAGGGQGPEMVVVPSGSFRMGSPSSETGRDDDEGPQRTVRINYQFAVGKYEVTWAEWDACVADGGCSNSGPEGAGGDNGWGRGTRPVIEVSWNDAQAYVQWLGRKTGEDYRLLSEAEWEYVARAGTTSAYWWDGSASHEYANYGSDQCCSGLASGRDRWVNTSPAGSFPANAFGLRDLHGNVWEWVEDCYVNSYSGAPNDGSARIVSDCSLRVLRGGSWGVSPQGLRSAIRNGSNPTSRSVISGFRVARTL